MIFNGKGEVEMNDDIKRLASYVTYRQLYDDSKCDIYFVVSKFAESIIISRKIYCFGLIELSEQINNQFGFSLPDYVIQSSLKRLNYVSRENNIYTVDVVALASEKDMVSGSMESAATENKKMTDDLVRFVERQRGVLSIEQQKQLKQEFCSFLLDDNIGNGFSEMISAFILSNENDKEFQSHLCEIKEGAVLYAGLNYNSDISDSSAWKEEIVVYVENEILFHLAGYNGEVFQRLAEDLFSLINEMNMKRKDKVIKVRYFRDVADEIDSFFKRAEDIVEGKDYVTLDNYAMAEIVKGCNSAADVIDKKAHFYSMLRNKSIREEEYINFYADEFHEYNLESRETVEKYQLADDKLRYIKHLNYVNILRKNAHPLDLKKSRYILLTETGKILKMASDFCEGLRSTPLAVNMYILTNRLWFDLNKGFGSNEFPATFDVLVKSRIVLSKILTQNVSDKFEQAKDKYRRKEIDEGQLTDSILLLREEIKKPEDIQSCMVEDVLSFISEEKIVIHQSEKELLANKLQSSEEENRILVDTIKRKTDENTELQEQAQKRDKEIEILNAGFLTREKQDIQDQMIDITKRKEIADKKIANFLKLIKNCIICLLILYYVGVLVIFIKGDEFVHTIVPILLAILPSALNILTSLYCEKRIDFFELYKKIINIIEKRYMGKIYSEYFINPNKINELNDRLKEIECGEMEGKRFDNQMYKCS